MEHLDLPSQSIPSELLDGVRAGDTGRSVISFHSTFFLVLRRPALLGTDTLNVRAG